MSDKALIGIVGSTTPSNEGLAIAEKLGRLLISNGFRIISGGMGGVMQAISKGGHSSSSWTGNEILGVTPGWGKDEVNPWIDIHLSSELGRYRNTLMIKIADAIIGIEGGAGTLSEISLAWQEKKPIGVFSLDKGWSSKLSGIKLDHRRKSPIMGFSKVDNLLSWLNIQFPKGCFDSTGDLKWYHGEVPCIHRIHDVTDPPKICSAHWFQMKIGMSLSQEILTNKLVNLNEKVTCFNDKTEQNRRLLVTFDDGYRDVLQLRDFFKKYPMIQPVLFIPVNILSEIPPFNWFDKFYLILEKIFSKDSILPNGDEDYSAIEKIKRVFIQDFMDFKNKIRVLPYDQQLKELEKITKKYGVNFEKNSKELYLSLKDLRSLKADGWLIEPHGVFHQNLTRIEQDLLLNEYKESFELVHQFNSEPWFAYPDGDWTEKIHRLALKSGFTRLFTINNRSSKNMRYLIDRTVWFGDEMWLNIFY